MQVTHTSDHITHAVIGGEASHAFGINDSPEFFRILSSSLYSDKKLAVIREVGCNAWDAHIEAGCTDQAIEFTLSNDKLVIKDFGPGISHANILKNYTTYGGTTKLANEQVTGGFGLGSKAPFAYVDHFEVVSCYKGTRSIYRMSLSSAELNGKPSVLKIMDTPCGDETGVTVSIDIDNDDYFAFQRLIKTVVSNGEMNATLNGSALQTVPYSASPNGYVLLPHAAMPSQALIGIRYGHVIYPLSSSEEIAQEYMAVKADLARFNSQDSWRTDWGVILHAPPGSVSITPSRESLSMTEKTIASLKTILTNFVNRPDRDIEQHCRKLHRQSIAQMWADGKPANLTLTGNNLPNPDFFANLLKQQSGVIYGMETAAVYYMASASYPKFNNFRKNDYIDRLTAMIDQDYGDKVLNRRFLRALRRAPSPEQYNSWAQRYVVYPLVKTFREAGKITHSPQLKNLFYFTSSNSRRGLSEPVMTTVRPHMTFGKNNSLRDCLPLLRRVLVLSHNRQDILKGEQFPQIDALGGSRKNYFCYIVPRSPAKIEAARALFTKLGFDLIDLTPDQEIITDKDDSSESLPRAPARPKRVGFPTLSSFMCETSDKDLRLRARHGYLENPSPVCLEAPAYYAFLSANKDDTATLPDSTIFGSVLVKYLSDFCGDEGVLVPSMSAVDKLKGLDIPHIDHWLMKELQSYLATRPKITHYARSYCPHIGFNGDTPLLWAQFVRSAPELRKRYKFPEPLSSKDFAALKLALSISWRHIHREQYPDLYNLVKSWTPNKLFENLQQKSASCLGRSIDCHEFRDALHSDKYRAQALKMFHLVMKD